MKPFDVITLGAATRDVFLRSRGIKVVRDESFPSGEAECLALGAKIDIDDIIFETGGGATNTAVGFARQGFRTAFIGKIGADDSRGREILRDLHAERVNTSLVIRDRRRSTAYSVLLLATGGERTALVYRGASADWHWRELPWSEMHARWLYITSLGGSIQTLRRIWTHAARRNIRLAWNPGAGELAWGLTTLRPFLKQVDVFFVNQEEAAELMHLTRDQDEAAFHRLRPLVGGATVVTQGTEGSLAGDHHQAWHCTTHHIRVVSTTGAGDAYGCGFISAFIRHGGDISRSMQFANANSESVIRHIGAKTGLLRRRSIAAPAAVTALAAS